MKGVKGSFMAALMVFQPTLNGKVPVGYSHVLRSNAGVIWCFGTPMCFCHALCSPVSSAIIFWEASWKPTSTDCAMCGARIKTSRSIQAFGKWFFSCTDMTLQFGEKNNHLRFLADYIYIYITPKFRQHLQPWSIIWSKTLSSRGLFEHNSRLFKFCTTLTGKIHVSKQFVLFRSHVFMITWQVAPSQW